MRYLHNKQDVVRLRKEIVDLGNINLNAIAEFEEIKERYDFYNEQITESCRSERKN